MKFGTQPELDNLRAKCVVRNLKMHAMQEMLDAT